MSDEGRDWLKIAFAIIAIGVTIGLSLLGVISELQRTTERHDAEHAGFRDDITELRDKCKTACK